MSRSQKRAWPAYSEEEIAAVQAVLESGCVNYWTGTEGREFEREFAAWCGSSYAVALANGSVALELALRVLGVGPGDEVIVSPRSYVASTFCAVLAGATPVFADVDRDSQNITVDTIRPVLTPRTRAIICVHLAGWPCDMEPIMGLADECGISVVEDCAQAHGAQYRGKPVGNLGHIAAWSFCQDKIITTGGEGGMLTTSRQDWWSSAWAFKDHGKSWNATRLQGDPPGYRWLHDSVGTNLRLTEVQAAIGRIQLRRIAQWHAQRLENARAIWSVASRLQGLRVPVLPSGLEHAAYRCYVFVDPQRLRDGWNRDRIMAEIVAAGVPCFTGSCPEIYRERALKEGGWTPRHRLPVARELGETSLAFLVHPTLTTDDLQRCCDALTDVMSRAAKQ